MSYQWQYEVETGTVPALIIGIEGYGIVIKKVQTSKDLTKNFSTTIHPMLFSFEISLYL